MLNIAIAAAALLLFVLLWSAHRRAVVKAQLESFHDLKTTTIAFEAVYNDAPVGYQDVDADGTIVRVNSKECYLRGLRPDEMIGKQYWELFPEPHHKRLQEEVRRKLSGEASLIPIQRNVLRPDGSLLTLELHEVLLRDHRGKVIGMRTASVDMTEPTKKQEQVWQATSELNAVFQAFPDLFLRLDSSGVVLGSRSPGNSDSFGPVADFSGRPLSEVFPQTVTTALLDAVASALRNGQLVSVEYSLVRSESWNGAKVRHFEARVIPLHWNEVVVIVRDISERKEAEQRLGQYAEELKRKNAEVEAKNEELVKALVTAREATKLKSQFLANMSHEIRTPMNGVLGMTEFLLGTALNSEQREYAESVKQSAEGLLVIINDILDLSKIEAGRLTVEAIPFDLITVVKEVASAFSLRARAKGLEFNLELHGKAPIPVQSDPVRIRQVLTNLLGNALKFTETGGITLRTRIVNAENGSAALQLQVEDTGIGIPDDQRERLFQSFVQVDGSMNRKYGGTGLGLAISKQLVTMLGGTIGFRSKYRQGSTFWFDIPFDGKALEKQQSAPPPAVSQPEPVTAATQDVTQAASLEGVSVLVAADASSGVRALLNRYGCRTEEVSRLNSIVPALRLAAQSERPYRVLLVDTSIAGMGGLSLGRTIRADGRIQNTVLIALSTDPASETPKLIEDGFAGILLKPIDGDRVKDTLLRALREGPAALASTIHSGLNGNATPRTYCGGSAGTFSTNFNSQLPGAKTPTPNVKRSARILLAEDNLVNQKIALRLLEKAGLNADLAKNGKEAVSAVQKAHYDLILMDCQMPEMDGFEATAAIRKLEEATRLHIPIVALTANAMTGDRERCLESGMDDYVSKPFDVKALQGLITRWLEPAASSSSAA